MRLIDADKKWEAKANDNSGFMLIHENGMYIVADSDGNIMCEFIDEQPTAYYLDRVAEPKDVGQENKKMNRSECLQTAEKIVCGDREDTYGSPEDNFKEIAFLWGDYLKCEITPKDVAHMMILLKVARAANGKHKDDNYVDIAGYAACACEIGRNE